MTRPVIPAPSTRVVEQHSGTVLSGEALKLANDRLDASAAESWAEKLAEDNRRLRRQLRSARADAAFQKSRADGYIDELDGVGEMQTRLQELEAEVRELWGEL